MFQVKNQTQAQKDFLNAIRSDESGNLIGFLTQVAKDSPAVHTNLKRLLNLTTHNLTKRLSQLNIDSLSIKEIFDNLEKSTKQDYKEAMEQVLSSVYDENYKVVLSRDGLGVSGNSLDTSDKKFVKTSYNQFRKELEQSGVLPEDSMRFLNFVESNIYNKNGVTFEQLNNALKTINSYYKMSLDPNFKDFSKRAVENFLKDDIKAGIEAIFAQNKSLYKDAQTLFNTALQDYANMKDTIKTIDRLKLRDEAITKSKALDNVFKYLQGQGGDVSNYTKITKSLNPQTKAMFELATLQGMFNKSLKQIDSIKIFDSNTFFKNLGELESIFQSKEAKDFIDIARGFHTLFKNDTLIAQSLSTPISKEVGSSIATTISGAVKFQMVKMMFEAIMRLMPHIPFAKGFNEKIQGMALRYHLRKALSQSSDISDFKFNISSLKDNTSLNSPTRELLNRIASNVDSLQDDIIEHAHFSSQLGNPLKEFGTNYPQYYHKPQEATTHLLETRGGQVAGAFYKEGLGDIDLVWGNENLGLQKIITKHLDDFKVWGEGEEGVIKGLDDIVSNGKVMSENGVDTIWLRKDGHYYVVGLSEGWKGQGSNKWIITSYEKRDMTPQQKENIDKLLSSDTRGLSPASEFNELQSPNPTTNVDSTTTLSPFARALKEKESMLAQEAARLQQERELQAQKIAQYAQKLEDIDKQKQTIAGLSANERVLNRGKSIDKESIGVDSNLVLDDSHIIPLEYVKINAKDVRPNFESNQLQPRTTKRDSIIESIATEFNPNLVIGVGGFKDLPIITHWGAVISGNHRLEGMLGFNQASRQTYEQAIQKTYGVQLKPDELLVRMPKENLSDKELVDIAFASNLNTTQNIGDKALASLGTYAKAIDTLPRYIESESVEDLAYQVARKLESANAYPDIESANLALFSHLAKNSNGNNIATALNNIDKNLDKELANKLKDMFIKNAGEWHNLVNNLGEYGMKNLELRPYLLDTLSSTAHMLNSSRAENFAKLAHNIEYLIKTTDAFGSSAMVEANKEVYKNTISDLLGASLARFVRLENPAGSLYEVLKSTKSDLEELVTPSLLSEGKPLSEIDVYDFVHNLIAKGESSEATSKVIDLLPALREKERAFNDSLGKQNLTTGEGNTTIPQDLQEKWVKEFGLKSVDEEFVPSFKPEVKEALEKAGITEDIKLTKGSLVKLVNRDRADFLPYIKETLENSDVVIKDKENVIIFAKDIGHTSYFTSVAKDDNGEWVISTNSYKTINQLKNRVNEGGELLYLSKEAPDILAEAFTAKTFPSELESNSTTNLSKEQIPQEQYKQTLKEIEEQEQYYHKLEYKPSIKPILENLQKEFKNNDYAILNWKERNSVGKMVVKKTNFRSYEDIKNTLQAYENYAKAGNNATKEIEAIQKALKDIEAQYTKKEQVRQEAQQALDELKEQKRALRLRYYKADIFTQYPHQTLAIQSKENQRSEVELLKHIKESNYLESITQAKEVVEQIRKDIQRDFNITPIAEFGTNYAENYRDGANAIAKVLRERQGQVAGAFYKEGLGDIDLVWGEITDATNHKGFGLSHILDKRTAEFMQEGLSEREAKAKAEELIGKIPNIVENGKVVELGNGKIRVVTDDYTIGMKNEWHNKPTNPYILTTFENNKKSDKNLHSTAFTKGETLPLNSKDDSTTKPFKQQDISFENFEDFSKYAKLSGI